MSGLGIPNVRSHYIDIQEFPRRVLKVVPGIPLSSIEFGFDAEAASDLKHALATYVVSEGNLDRYEFVMVKK